MSAYLHHTLGQALCDILNIEKACILTIESGRSSAVTTDAGLTGSFMNRFPFTYQRGDSLQDSQEQMIRGMEYDWVLHMAGEAFKKCSGHEIILDMITFIGESSPWEQDQMACRMPEFLSLDEALVKRQTDGLLVFVNPSGLFTVNYTYNSDKIDTKTVEQLFDRWNALIHC